MSPTYGLQFSDLVTRVQDYANINNISGADTKAKRAINDALRKLAAMRRWYALRRQGTITPVTSTQSYALTSLSDFNYPVRVFYISNGIEEPIDIVSDEVWAQKNDNDDDGDPTICAFLEISGAFKLYLSPRPSSSFVSLYSTIYIDYDKKPTELSTDTSIPDIPPTNLQMALVYLAVAELNLKQGDIANATAWEVKARNEINNYFKNDIHFRGVKRQRGKPLYGILHGVNRETPQRDYK